MELSDLESVAKLHMELLPSGFFGKLGEKFLITYYRSYLTSPAAVALMVDVEGRRAGYLVGTIDETSHREHVIKLERTRLAIIGLWCLVTRPRLIPRFAKTRMRKYGRAIKPGTHRTARKNQPNRTGVLHHIAIASTHQRDGLGHELVSNFMSIGRIHSVESFRLLTQASNKSAIAFYLKNGWSTEKEVVDTEGEGWMLMTC